MECRAHTDFLGWRLVPEPSGCISISDALAMPANLKAKLGTSPCFPDHHHPPGPGTRSRPLFPGPFVCLLNPLGGEPFLSLKVVIAELGPPSSPYFGSRRGLGRSFSDHN